MNKVILHQSVEVRVNDFLDKPAHLLILSGPNGAGKTTIAERIISSLIGSTYIDNNPNKLTIRPTNSTISIADIRTLQAFTRLKTVGEGVIRRGIIIEHSESLTNEAQNALLKLLEEPPSDTIIVLTVNSDRSLLPTIYSRAQLINVISPSETIISEFFADQGYDKSKVRKAYLFSNGLPGLMTAVLSQDNSHELLNAVDVAKTILNLKAHERLILVTELSQDKVQLKELIFAFQRIAQASLQNPSSSSTPIRVRKWHQILKQSLQAESSLTSNANPKLVLTNLFLAI